MNIERKKNTKTLKNKLSNKMTWCINYLVRKTDSYVQIMAYFTKKKIIKNKNKTGNNLSKRTTNLKTTDSSTFEIKAIVKKI